MTSNLKREAEEIVKNLQFISMLSQYGKAEIVGSVALNLVVKKDIDIHVLLYAKDLLRIAHEISNKLLEKPQVEETRISDWREIESMKISIDEFEGISGLWDIEIWLTIRPDMTGFDLVRRLNRELTREKRDTIMHLKRYFYEKGLLKNGMSKKIYTAVLDNNVKTIKEFEEYLNENLD